MRPCARCAAAIDERRALYTDDGDLVCQSCHAAVTVEKSYAKAVRATAYATLASGLGTTMLSCLAPFVKKLGVPLVALGVVGTVGSFRYLSRPEARRAAGDDYTRLRLIAGIGVVFCVVGPIVMIVLLVAMTR